MSQRIVTECDECAEVGEARDGVTVELRALGQSLEIDLCDLHQKPLVDLVVRYAHLGRSAGKASPGRAVCPRCGREFKSPQALGKHAKEVHGESVSALRARVEAPAVSALESAPEQPHLTCPECGAGFATPQALGVHRSKRHGVRGESYDAKRRRREALAAVESPGGESRL